MTNLGVIVTNAEYIFHCFGGDITAGATEVIKLIFLSPGSVVKFSVQTVAQNAWPFQRCDFGMNFISPQLGYDYPERICDDCFIEKATGQKPNAPAKRPPPKAKAPPPRAAPPDDPGVLMF